MPKSIKLLLYFVIVIIAMCVLHAVVLFLLEKLNLGLQMNDTANFITACAAIGACIYSYVEYKDYKKKDQMDAFAHYNERYSKDKNIQAVSEYLIDFLEHEKPTKEMPSIYEKEMFMRFFEELELQIEIRRISEDIIQHFFIYYAVAAVMCEHFVEHTELKDGRDDNDVWKNYKKLISRYCSVESVINKEYLKNHPNTSGIKILIEL